MSAPTTDAGSGIELDLLGVALTSPEVTTTLDLCAAEFTDARHGAVWEAIRGMHARGVQIVADPTLLLEEIGHATRVDDALILDLIGRNGFVQNAEEYAKKIRNSYRLRHLLEAMHQAINLAEVGAPVEDVAAKIGPAISKATTPSAGGFAKIGEPLDWRARWDAASTGEDWLLEPLIGKGRLVSIYSPPKAGKSLLMLEIAAAIATGIDVLGQPVRQGPVVYVDFENDPDGDVIPRLQDLGYAEHQLDELHYYSFPTLDTLDTPNGGRELLMLAQRHDAALVVIDTVSRTVAGEENANDTWLAFYRHTALLLKRAGIACVRLDHSGKDPTKGQRGGSAKGGDIDAVWKLTAVGQDTVHLECEATRQKIADEDKIMVLSRRTYPLRHELESKPGLTTFESRVKDVLAKLDAYQIDHEAGRRGVREALRAHGVTARNDVLGEALKRRRSQPVPDPKSGPRTVGTTPQDGLVPDGLGPQGTSDAV